MPDLLGFLLTMTIIVRLRVRVVTQLAIYVRYLDFGRADQLIGGLPLADIFLPFAADLTIPSQVRFSSSRAR